MNIEEIERLITSYLEQSIGGLDKENPKFDFKKKWYNLTNLNEINEFLKDASSIANTFGPDGFIVIGFDENLKTFSSTTFSDSGLRDSSNIINLINKNVDRLFDLNTIDIKYKDNCLSVIHIAPSIDKPHVIKLYRKFGKDGKEMSQVENKIFVRKNSNTFSASKYDLELMYYDRKNLIPDFQIHANYHLSSIVFNINHEDRIQYTSYITLENSGRRPVAINSISFKVYFFDDPSEHDITYLNSDHKLLANNIVINSNQIWNGRIDFFSDRLSFYDNQQRNQQQEKLNSNRKWMKHSPLELKLANGEKVFTELTRIQ